MGYVLNKGNSGNIVVGNSTIAEIEKVLSKSNAIGKCSSGVVFIDLINNVQAKAVELESVIDSFSDR